MKHIGLMNLGDILVYFDKDVSEPNASRSCQDVKQLDDPGDAIFRLPSRDPKMMIAFTILSLRAPQEPVCMKVGCS